MEGKQRENWLRQRRLCAESMQPAQWILEEGGLEADEERLDKERLCLWPVGADSKHDLQAYFPAPFQASFQLLTCMDERATGMDEEDQEVCDRCGCRFPTNSTKSYHVVLPRLGKLPRMARGGCATKRLFNNVRFDDSLATQEGPSECFETALDRCSKVSSRKCL